MAFVLLLCHFEEGVEEDEKEERPQLPCSRLGYQLSCIRVTRSDAEEVEEVEGTENEGRWLLLLLLLKKSQQQTNYIYMKIMIRIYDQNSWNKMSTLNCYFAYLAFAAMLLSSSSSKNVLILNIKENIIINTVYLLTMCITYEDITADNPPSLAVSM